MAENNPSFNQIKKRTDYLKTHQKGQRLQVTPWLKASVLKTQGDLRVGWTLPKAIGSAVVRNRIKRTVREFLRQNSTQLKSNNSDVVLYFRTPRNKPSLKEISRDEVRSGLHKLFLQIP